jgi:hypothetical protein
MSNDSHFENAKLGISEKYTGQKNITFVIQGKMTDQELLIRNIRNLCRWGKVVLAVWGINESLNESLIKSFVKRNGLNNEQNLYLQVYTTVYGLSQVTTPFVVKVRADEYYLDFKEFINEMKISLDKIVTTNIFFRKVNRYPYHISDHIIGGLTENVKRMFNNCKKVIETKRSFPKINKGVPEQWLTVSYLLSFYSETELFKGDVLQYMKSNFKIVPLEEFKDFVVVYTQSIKSKRIKMEVKGIDDLKNHRIIDIKSIE